MFNWIDGVIVLVIIFYIFDGYRRGFIEQILELAGFVLSVFLALWTYHGLEGFVANHFHLTDRIASSISFLVVLIVYQAIYSLALRFLYPLIPFNLRHAKTNRILGIFAAVAKSIVILAVVLTLIAVTPITAVSGLTTLRNEVNASYIGGKIVARSSEVESVMNKVFGGNAQDDLTFLTVPAKNEQIIGPDEKVDLHFTTTNVTVDEDSERKMLDLLNGERIKQGLQPLVYDEQLTQIARAQSADMFARGYFAHTNPDGLSPFDRMDKAGIKYKSAGENLAYAANVELAHEGLMRSPGHRANILETHFGRVGIGVIDAGPYGKMFTQDFTN